MKLYRHILLFASLATLANASSSSLLYVGDGSGSSDVVNIFNSTGSLIGTAAPPGGFDFPTGIALGPNGNIFIGNESSGSNAEVYEFNGTTLTPFIPYTSGPGSLGIPTGLAFGPDQNLYVADQQQNLVNEYNGTTGAFIATIIPSASSLLSPEGLAFGPNGNLYIADGNGIEEWNGATLTNFATINGSAMDLAFGPNGELYVTDTTNSLIRVFNSSGVDTQDFGSADVGSPIGLAFGSDGNLYVTGNDDSPGGNGAAAILLFDPTSGAFIHDFYAFTGTDTFINPQFLAFGSSVPEPSTMLLGAFGIAALIAVNRRRNARSRPRNFDAAGETTRDPQSRS